VPLECCLGYGDDCPTSWDCPSAPPENRVSPLPWNDRYGEGKGAIGLDRRILWTEGEANHIAFLAHLYDQGAIGGPQDGGAHE